MKGADIITLIFVKIDDLIKSMEIDSNSSSVGKLYKGIF